MCYQLSPTMARTFGRPIMRVPLLEFNGYTLSRCRNGTLVACFKQGPDGIYITSIMCLQVFGSVLATTSKLVVGKEGTMTNVGACIAHMLSTQAAKLIGGAGAGKRRNAHGDKLALRQGFSEADMRDLVTVGAAAGISACFRAPVRVLELQLP